MALWTPADITTTFWYNAPALSLADNDAVASWTDLSGNARHGTQGTAGSRPTFKTAIQNGLAVVRFDGSADFLDMGADIGFAAQPFTIAVVGTSQTDQRRWITGKTSQIAISRETTNSWQMYAGTFRQYAASANSNWHVHVCHFAGASSYGSFDGTKTTPATPGTGAPTNGAMLGANNTGAGNFHNGDMGEVIGFTGAHDQDLLETVEGYLHHKWGLEANLPADHPYRFLAPGEVAGFFYMGEFGGIQFPQPTRFRLGG